MFIVHCETVSLLYTLAGGHLSTEHLSVVRHLTVQLFNVQTLLLCATNLAWHMFQELCNNGDKDWAKHWGSLLLEDHSKNTWAEIAAKIRSMRGVESTIRQAEKKAEAGH